MEIKESLRTQFKDYDYGLAQSQRKTKNLESIKKNVSKKNNAKLKKTQSYLSELEDNEREKIY